jgi:hypothetical protein
MRRWPPGSRSSRSSSSPLHRWKRTATACDAAATTSGSRATTQRGTRAASTACRGSPKRSR